MTESRIQVASSPKGEGKVWLEELTRNRLQIILHQKEGLPWLTNLISLSEAWTKGHGQADSHLPFFIPYNQLNKDFSASHQHFKACHPLLSPIAPGWKADFPLSFSQLEIQVVTSPWRPWSPWVLGQGQRFTIHTLLTDRFFIYTFPSELSFQYCVCRAGHTSSVALANSVINDIPPCSMATGVVSPIVDFRRAAHLFRIT